MRSEEEIRKMIKNIDALELALEEERGESLEDFSKGWRAALKWVLEEE